jgi:predicted nucleic acid-binding protein
VVELTARGRRRRAVGICPCQLRRRLPRAAGGGARSARNAARLVYVREFRRLIRLLPEEKPLLSRLLELLAAVPCRGKKIHDAHIVAAADVHRIGVIATLNTEDFSLFGSRLTIVTPAHR